jgi:hypothetical protein
MSKKNKTVVSLASRKLEAIVGQIARTKDADGTASFSMRELETMRDELLAEING